MGSLFVRGFRRLFGLKEKSRMRLAPYGSIARPVLITNYEEPTFKKAIKSKNKKLNKRRLKK